MINRPQYLKDLWAFKDADLIKSLPAFVGRANRPCLICINRNCFVPALMKSKFR